MPGNHERRLLGAWLPDASPSTMALVWRFKDADGATFKARITRYGETIEEIEASNLDDLATKLTARCGPARKSMVKLGVTAWP